MPRKRRDVGAGSTVAQPMCGTIGASSRSTTPGHSPRPGVATPCSTPVSNITCIPTQIPSTARPPARRRPMICGPRTASRPFITAAKAPIVPHMGWATVEPAPTSRLFRGIEDERFYFVHSYAARSFPLLEAGDAAFVPPAVTWADHGGPFVAAVENGPLSATQFHPEKSGDVGAQLLATWVESLR